MRSSACGLAEDIQAIESELRGGGPADTGERAYDNVRKAFGVLMEQGETLATRERLDATHLAILDKLDANHRELLGALERQIIRTNSLESGLARVDERTRK